jgi:hypothetical protein
MTRRYDEYEVRYARRLLEELGFVVRLPGHANVPVKVRVVGQKPQRFGFLPLRIDTEMNGVPYALGEHFPLDMLLDENFRKNAVPHAYADRLAHYITERLLETLPREMEAALSPLVAEAEAARDRMSLSEITTFIDRALNDPAFDADAWDAARLAERRKE